MGEAGGWWEGLQWTESLTWPAPLPAPPPPCRQPACMTVCMPHLFILDLVAHPTPSPHPLTAPPHPIPSPHPLTAPPHRTPSLHPLTLSPHRTPSPHPLTPYNARPPTWPPPPLQAACLLSLWACRTCSSWT